MNMSYCRFRNTLEDLKDCYEHWDSPTSPEEKRARTSMLNICRNIVADYEEVGHEIKETA